MHDINCNDCKKDLSTSCFMCSEGGGLGSSCLFEQKDKMMEYTIVWFDDQVQVLVASDKDLLIERLREVFVECHDSIKLYKGHACFANLIEKEDWPVEYKKEMVWELVNNKVGIYNMSLVGKYGLCSYTRETLINLVMQLNKNKVKTSTDISLWRDFEEYFCYRVDFLSPFKLVEKVGTWVLKDD